MADLKGEIGKLEKVSQELKELKELAKLGEEDIAKELKEKCAKLEREIEEEETRTFFSGNYDKNNAILQISAGAGGVDAEDWATMLLRMYERYCQNKGFSVFVLSQSFGEGGGPEGRVGTKSVTLEIKGSYAFGYLKKESGIHRLVRQSPFSSSSLRHTSFAAVEVFPEIGEQGQKEIKIDPDDLKIETFRASGPGGQYVNRRESAIRITHLPTKITVSSQAERLQGQNRQNAMKVLYSKLYQLKEQEKKKEIEKIKGKEESVSWGNQIRSYVLHPYKMVKDLRTGVETSDPESVLDGELDPFITAEIKNIK